eukprot:CAMPEP_0201510346 /NCGR_PEP_ID=MMETSP0161_2-20130828/3072_1 /ASSEMBLY_ACC=CAM_ASM_000251 /TAXON_ID=180227 /ORGANISM="Neoparamoeba aestuarina, Strain SoJaBio B1-5/56/2" /LENGTH=288 /DNA_ID=CAMNT_0047905499 /DNA_START=46 /DNA_END=912 /DNA_ORIENTATION=-
MKFSGKIHRHVCFAGLPTILLCLLSFEMVFPHKTEHERAVLFFHLHKAGGTTVCLMSQDVFPHVRRRHHCNCRFLDYSDVSGSRDYMLRRGYHYCAVERKNKYPHPKKLLRVLREWQGKTGTVLREPWSRFRSNFERDHLLVNIPTIEEFAKPGAIGSQVEFGDYNLPNFYVRMLNGLGNQTMEGKEDDLLLETAKKVLSSMSTFIVYEAPAKQVELGFRDLFDTKDAINVSKHISSNNFYHLHSNSSTFPRPPSDHYRDVFMEQNKLDLALYAWALERMNARYNTTK